MTRRALSQIERRSIWEVGGKVCAYCGQPLQFSAVEVDHIIPQAIEGDDDQLNCAKQEYRLADNFDFNGLENFAPACRRCNGRKSDILHGRISIELATASRLKVRITQRIDQLTAQSHSEKAIFLFAEAVQAGIVAESDANKIFSGGRPTPTELSPEDSMAHALADLVVGDVSQKSIDRIMSMPVDLPEHLADGLRLTSLDDLESVHVKTLTEYQQLINRGFYALTTFDMIHASLFQYPLRLLEILKFSRFPDISFINKPHRGICDLNILPGGILCYGGLFESEESYVSQYEDLNKRTIGEMVETGEVAIECVGSNFLRLKQPGQWTYLREIFRTDVDGDGVEDLIVMRAGGPVGGTYRSNDVIVLKRTGDDAMFEESSALNKRSG